MNLNLKMVLVGMILAIGLVFDSILATIPIQPEFSVDVPVIRVVISIAVLPNGHIIHAGATSDGRLLRGTYNVEIGRFIPDADGRTWTSVDGHVDRNELHEAFGRLWGERNDR